MTSSHAEYTYRDTEEIYFPGLIWALNTTVDLNDECFKHPEVDEDFYCYSRSNKTGSDIRKNLDVESSFQMFVQSFVLTKEHSLSK